MSGTTPNLDLPYPTSGDGPPFEGAIADLAAALDAIFGQPAAWSPSFSNITGGDGTFEAKFFGLSWLHIRATFTAGTATASGVCKFHLPSAPSAQAFGPQVVPAWVGTSLVVAGIPSSNDKSITFNKAGGSNFTTGDSIVGYTFTALLSLTP